MHARLIRTQTEALSCCDDWYDGDKIPVLEKLRGMGYERVELIDTTDGSFMTPKEARRLMLRGSTLLVGRK